MKKKEVTGQELVEYYKRKNLLYSFKSAWKNLQNKSDADFDRSEKGYQMIAKQMAGRIADALGCDVNKTELLSMAIGAFYPRNGMAGLKFISEYAKRNEIDVEPVEFAVDCIDESVGEGDGYIPADFDVAVRGYFSGDDTIPEVGIVRTCQNTISKVKAVEKYKNNLNRRRFFV